MRKHINNDKGDGKRSKYKQSAYPFRGFAITIHVDRVLKAIGFQKGSETGIFKGGIRQM